MGCRGDPHLPGAPSDIFWILSTLKTTDRVSDPLRRWPACSRSYTSLALWIPTQCSSCCFSLSFVLYDFFLFVCLRSLCDTSHDRMQGHWVCMWRGLALATIAKYKIYYRLYGLTYRHFFSGLGIKDQDAGWFGTRRRPFLFIDRCSPASLR